VQALELNKLFIPVKHHHCFQHGRTNSSPICFYFKYLVTQEETSDKCHRNGTEIDSRRFRSDLYHCSHFCATLSVGRRFSSVE
jgi:hypothetical protein